jgi:dCTP diphosphatase
MEGVSAMTDPTPAPSLPPEPGPGPEAGLGADPLLPLRQRLLAFAQARDWLPFHSPKNLASALSVEAAELLEPFQWLTEEQSRHLPPAVREAVVEEMADVFIYLLQMCNAMDVDLLAATRRKIDRNEQRYPVALARGHNRKAGPDGLAAEGGAPVAPPGAPGEALFRRVVEAAPNGLLLVDAQGCIRLANRKAEELLGWPAGALAGLPVQHLVPQALRAGHAQLMAGLQLEGGSRAMGPGATFGPCAPTAARCRWRSA